MNLNLRLGLAIASLGSVTLLAGCPGLINTPPGTTPSTTTEGKLQGRLTFALNTDSNPGAALTVGLKRKLAAESSYASIDTTTSTDNSGNFTFSGLTPASYQLKYDDEGKVAATTFNTTGVAVSDPVEVVASQSAIPQQNMELAWDFTGSTVAPQPNGTLPSRTGATFTWAAKAGVTSPVYAVTIFTSSNTGSGALQSSATTSATTVTFDLTSAVTAGTRYYVVKYWKNGGSYLGANYYGQTKPIPFTVP